MGEQERLFILGLRAALLPVPKLDPSLSSWLHSFPTSYSELPPDDIEDDAWVDANH